MRYEGKVVVITGGNAGIGLSAARTFASLGAKVVISGRRREVMNEITESETNIYGVVADASDIASASVIVGFAIKKFGRIDVLVNNVGAGCLGGIEQYSVTNLKDVLDVNVLYLVRMVQESLPHLVNTKGNIVNITSTYGHKAAPYASAYGLSKAAVEHLTKSLAIELAPKSIRVNAVAPGPTESDFLKERMKLSPEEIAAVKESEIAAIPIGRRGNPEDVAHWVVEMASADDSWVTGQVVNVDGGLSAA